MGVVSQMNIVTGTSALCYTSHRCHKHGIYSDLWLIRTNIVPILDGLACIRSKFFVFGSVW